jgi:hypothetical protein
VENDGSGEPTKIAGGAPGAGPRAWTELGEGRGGAQDTSRRSRGGAGKKGRNLIEQGLKLNYQSVIHPTSEFNM